MLRVFLLLSLYGCAAKSSYRAYDSPPQSAVANRPSYNDAMSNRTESESVVLSGSVSARSRAFDPASAAGAVGAAVGNLFSGQTPAAPPTAQPLAAPKTDPEKLVVEAWIDMRVDDPAKATAEIRAKVEAAGGRVISENVIGPQNKASSAAMELRVPPLEAAGFQSWLGSKGLIESRRVMATDVGKQLFDQELALKNLDVTMTRLQKIAEKDAPMKELIEIETEMTRVRGQLERIKGEQRWLLDRVAFATITLTLSREGGPVEFAPHARIHPGIHIATLTLIDPGDRPKSRVGGGGTIHIKRWLTFDLDVFPRRDGDSRAVVGTLGSALYSSFLGGGRRSFLNPFLGYRLGVGYLSGESSPVMGAEVGIEIYKHKYVQIEASLRALAFLREDTDAALHGQLGLAIPF